MKTFEGGRLLVPDRNPALDFCKGVLVLFMVLYHWINYFVGVQGPVYTYLRFIPPSFIFVTGFLLANVYPVRYGFAGAPVYRRLVVRGLKLLLLFLLLNVAANLVFATSYNRVMPGLDGFIRDLPIILASGHAKAAFSVLVPISYLLILSALIFLIARWYKQALPFICMGIYLAVVLLDWYGWANLNLTLVGIGALGLWAGCYPLHQIDAWVDHPLLVVTFNVAYLVIISFWGVGYFMQAIGVCLSAMLIYMIAIRSAAFGEWKIVIVMLGQYSLFGYVSQICLLQVLQRSLAMLSLGHWGLWITSFIGAFALTIGAVMVAQYGRGKSSLADRLYRVAFA